MPGRANTAALVPSPLANDPVRVVSIGGGTGLSTVLSGLKEYARGVHGELPALGPPEVDVTTCVSVRDAGGGSGRLRRVFDIRPPGDSRNCMLACPAGESPL